jgi:site-specific recombinase XerD
MFFDGIAIGRRPDEFLFIRDDGVPWGTHDHHRPMAAAVIAANLPEDTVFYSLRHTYASQCLMAGMNVQLLAENMGTSVTMIEKHYGKFTKLARQQQIEAGVPKLNLHPSNDIPLGAYPLDAVSS